MTTLASVKEVLVTGIRSSNDTLVVEFNDGRSVSLPFAWYPRLAQAPRIRTMAPLTMGDSRLR